MQVVQWLSKPLSILCCGLCPDYSDTYVLVNARKYAVIRLLRDDGLKFLYLVRMEDGAPFRAGSAVGSGDEACDGLYTLKQIRCPIGNIDSVADSMREIDNYRRFQSPYVVSSVDSQVVQELDGSKTVYVVFPYYPLGSLQDSIDDRLLDGTYVSESECVRIMCGIARGLLCLHDSSSVRRNKNTGDNDIDSEVNINSSGNYRDSGNSIVIGDSFTDRDTNSMTFSDEAAALLQNDNHILEMDSISSNISVSPVSYSHRNLTPSNIIFSANGLPIIGELGSCAKADVSIETRKHLNQYKEWVEDNFNTYMAPEFLSLKIGSKLDSKVDVWSLGCICYTLLFSINPFDREEQLYGASIRYAISTGKYTLPEQSRYSQNLINIIQSCLQVEPSDRPSVSIILNNLQELQS
ncbi:Serine/threonine-protein kinase ENV7 [Nakaseomyces bracarensis]|uniref:non-specific serine/threonine protein kinase n=1 Tax=Nakaseomyces bracarensis TaxID=273131 RepID=A0ABR4NRF4_9SACH